MCNDLAKIIILFTETGRSGVPERNVIIVVP